MSGEKSFDLTKVHEVNLKLLKEIDRICRKYKIKYALDSGRSTQKKNPVNDKVTWTVK